MSPSRIAVLAARPGAFWPRVTFVGAFLCWGVFPDAGRAAPAATPAEFTQKLLGRAAGAGTGKDKGKSYACFARKYDARHLYAHPRQNVRAMTLLVSVGGKQADPEVEGASAYGLRIGVNFKSRRKLFKTDGSCASPRAEAEAGGAVAAHCGVDCDGGSIDVALKDNGSVLLRIPDGVSVEGPDADPEGAGQRGAFGADDKLFRLDRADLSQCLPLAVTAGERAALRK